MIHSTFPLSSGVGVLLSDRVTQTFIAKESECSGIFLLLFVCCGFPLTFIIRYGNTKKYLRSFSIPDTALLVPSVQQQPSFLLVLRASYSSQERKSFFTLLLSDVQLLSCVQLFATPWTVAHQTPLSFTISWNLLKFMSTELVMLSSHLILCRPLSFCLQSLPASESFPMSQLFASGGQSIGASASVLPMNIQGWFPLGWTGWISLQSKGLSRVFSSTTVGKHQFFSAQPSL